MFRHSFRNLLLAAVACTVLGTMARADHPALKEVKTGDPGLKSIEAITFGPKGLLIIGDGRGKQIVAIDTKDTEGSPWTKNTIKNIVGEIAGRLGTDAKGIEINKIAVNSASNKAYIAVRKLEGKEDLIVTVDGKGQIRPFDLSNVTYSKVTLPTDAKVATITDVCWADGRILVASQATDTFGSKMFSIATPIDSKDPFVSFATETYHVAHRRWETKAPILTIIPFKENEQQYAVGAFTCTPIVKYPLNDIKEGAKVKGASVIELGNGNHPRDMFVYEKGGKKYILMNTFRFFHKRKPVGPSPYWTVKVDYDLLNESEKVNENALVRVNKNYENVTDRAEVVPTYHGVMHMDILGNGRAVAIATDESGAIDLKVLPLP